MIPCSSRMPRSYGRSTISHEYGTMWNDCRHRDTIVRLLVWYNRLWNHAMRWRRCWSSAAADQSVINGLRSLGAEFIILTLSIRLVRCKNGARDCYLQLEHLALGWM